MSVKPNCDPKSVKKAYKLLSRVLHPDRNSAKDAGEKFNTLKQAFDILSSPKLKARYDRFLKEMNEYKEQKTKMSAKRKKFADDLRRREAAFQSSGSGYSSKGNGRGGSSSGDDLNSFMKKKKSKNVDNLFNSFS